MQVPLEVSYRDVKKTEDIENIIKTKVDKLEKVCDYITSGHIAIEKPQSAIDSGNPYRIRLEFRIPPQHQVIIKKEPGEGDMHHSLETVLNHQFDVALRKIKKIVEKQRDEIKAHPDQEVSAVVSKLFPEENYGFLETVNGREIYFHRNSVVHNEFDKIKIGAGVRFFEEEGTKGPQASTVQIIENPGASNN